MKKSIISFLALCLMVSALFAGCAEKVTYENEYVKLGQYKGLKTSSLEVDNMDEEIDGIVATNFFQNNMEATPVTDRDTVKKWDLLNIDYMGKIKDVAFNGGTAEGQSLLIGSGQFIPGFEDQLIGVKKGETVDIKVTFPEAYHSADLAGKDAVFTVTVNEISSYALTDELVSTISNGQVTTVSDYRKSLESQVHYNKSMEKDNYIMAQIIDNSEVIKYPEGVVENYVQQQLDYYQQMAEANETTIDALLSSYGVSLEDYKKELTTQYQYSVKQQLVNEALIEAEKIELTEDEYKKGAEKYATEYGFDVATFEEQYGVETIENAIKQEKLWEILHNNSKEEKGFTYTAKQ